MDTIFSLLRANLTPEEYAGYLKGSAAENALKINAGDNNGCAAIAKRCIDELMLPREPENRRETSEPAKSKPVRKSAAKEKQETSSVPEKGIARTDVDADKIRALYIERGLPARECCALLGVSFGTFKRLLAKNGIQKFPKKSKASASPEPRRQAKTASDYGNYSEDAISRAAVTAARSILGG